MLKTGEYISYAKDIGFAAGASLAVALLGFISLPILTKYLGASLYGVWSLLLVTVYLILPLPLLSLQESIVRFLSGEKDKEKIREGFLSAVFTVLATGVFFSLVVILCSDFLASAIFGDINSSYFIRIGAFMILTRALTQMTLAFFRTLRLIKWYSALMLGQAVCELGLMICFLHLGWGLRGIIIAVLASGVLTITIFLFVALRRIGFQFPKFAPLRSYLKYGLPLIPNVAILWIIHSSDRYMIGHFLGATDVGIYAAAYTLGSLVSLLLNPVGVVLFPTISKLYDDGKVAETKTCLKYSLKYLMLLIIPVAFGLSALASPLLQIMTTSEFTSGSVVVPFVTFGLVLFSFYQVGVYIILLVKKTSWIVRLLGISAALNIGLNLVLIPHLGILGAAVATVIAYGVLGVLTLLISFRYLKFDISFRALLKSVFASIVMVVAIIFFDPIGLSQLIICVALGVAVYFGTIFLLKGFNKNELGLLKEIAMSFKRIK